jgi:hypothetical protein
MAEIRLFSGEQQGHLDYPVTICARNAAEGTSGCDGPHKNYGSGDFAACKDGVCAVSREAELDSLSRGHRLEGLPTFRTACRLSTAIYPELTTNENCQTGKILPY